MGEATALGRFEMLAQLGSGAAGVVFRARDRERGDQEVALKILRQVDPVGIYRFKQEFRALADVVHPNLVPLYELISNGDQWFFTMELVDGVDFLRYVRGGDWAGDAVETRAATVTPSGGPDATMETQPSGHRSDAPRWRPPLVSGRQYDRLRRSLGQLARGVCALHRIGQLHRDIKPSNVLVTADGRVVLLDFGIATAISAQRRSDGTSHIIGTPAYMAPEQAVGAALTEACDWYAVGVMLFEALTGRRPFDGGRDDVLAAKQSTDPPRPRELAPRAPFDLDELCARLLARDPAARPRDDELLERLAGSHGASVPVPAAMEPIAELPLIGRERELAALHQAVDAVRAGESRVIYVHGSSGMGKSSLLETFAAQSRSGGTVVLQGQCYERELVPNKALDSLIDALAQHLVSLPGEALWTLMPRDLYPLARLFPVLRRVEPILASTVALPDTADPHELRRRAVTSLRALLTTLAARRPLVLILDDLQWGDLDSATLLAELLQPPDAPRLLLIASYRSEDEPVSPFLRAFVPAYPDAVRVAVDRLPVARARDLAEALLGDARDAAPTVARESDGNPIFVIALARHVRAGAALSLDGTISLRDVIDAHVGQLSAEARRLLEVVAVAGLPIEQAVGRRVAELAPDDRLSLAELRSARLVRTRGVRDDDVVQIFHDRIRAVVLARLQPEVLAGLSARLAMTLEGEGADSEWLAALFEAGGQPMRAAGHYARAANNATDTLAFDRAAALSQRSLELDPGAGADRAERLARLGQALGDAGRGAEAADAYLLAANHAPAGTALDYRRRAAEHLLHSGYIDRGRETLADVLAAVRLRPPAATPIGAIATLLLRRALIRTRGLRFHPRDETQLTREHLTKIDVCGSAAVGYGMFDVVRGADFQTRHVLLSLRSGERFRVARSLAVEACYHATEGERGIRRARRIVERALPLAAELDDPVATAWAWEAAALADYMDGQWRSARDNFVRVERVVRQNAAGLAWELTVVQLHHLWAMYYAGDIAMLAERVPLLLRDARQRGDLYNVANLSTGLPAFAWLARDRAEQGRRAAIESLAGWSPHGFHLQHYWQMLALGHIALYEGDGAAALAAVDDPWADLKRSLFLRLRIVRVEAFGLRGRALVAAARQSERGRETRLRAADRAAARVGRETLGCAGALAAAIRAGAAAVRGDHERAAGLFEAAEAGLVACDMPMHAAAAQRRRGLLRCDHAIVAAADAALRACGIVDPERITDTLCP